jgi:DNA polymerase V
LTTREKLDTRDRFRLQRGSEKLITVLDGLNDRFGSRTVFPAGSGIAPAWRVKAENLTPRYTTCFEELPRVRA